MQAEPQQSAEVVTAANVDLTDCDRELVHMPGRIQPHGVMVVLRPTDLAILQASENTATLFDVAATDLTFKGLAALLGPEQAAAVSQELVAKEDRLDSGPTHLLQLPPTPKRDRFDAIAHRAGNVLILEFERCGATPPRHQASFSDVTESVDRLRSADTLPELLDSAVAEVRSFSGFDRVMAYRFDDDGSGEVVAEAHVGGLTSYLGLHFPAGDIPAPARRLFAMSAIRHLPDASYMPVRLLPEGGPPVDMSRAILRHVSAMYGSYLKNIGAHATMVMRLLSGGRLWGLICCMHHTAPLHVPFMTRKAAEVLLGMVSSLMAGKEDLNTAQYQADMNTAIAGLGRQMAEQTHYLNGLWQGDFSVLGWLDAPGAALVTDDRVILLGTTPTELEVQGMVAWLEERNDPAAVFATDRLPNLYPPGEAVKNTACGLLAVRPLRTKREFLLWFRPEVDRPRSWAGDPHKPVQVAVAGGETRLTPRTSFAPWREIVRGHSKPWLACEVAAAAALRQAIGDAALLRLNKDLQRSNTELDNFAYIAAHDLKEPLRGISNFSHFLMASASNKLNDEERGRIETIIRLTRRMDDLTDVLLHYARVGSTDVALEAVDLNELMQHSLDLLATRLAETGTSVRIAQRLPVMITNRAHITEVLSNLIVNATKYNDRPPHQRWIEIGWRNESGRVVVHVRDNGIGIAKQHLEQIFMIFRRLHGRDEYGGGNGAGLTIARRTVERLGGRLWVESDGVGTGATFLFHLPGSPIERAQP